MSNLPKKDWKKKTLKDVGVFSKGKGLSGESMTGNSFSDAEFYIPCIGYGDIYMKYNIAFNKAQNYTTKEAAAESTSIGSGTLLFTGSGETAEEIGKCVCYDGDEPIVAGGDIILFNSDKVLPKFLAYQQYTNALIKQKARWGQGHSVVHIYKDQLAKLPCYYPASKHEQERIVKILDTWQDAVRLQGELIDKLKL